MRTNGDGPFCLTFGETKRTVPICLQDRLGYIVHSMIINMIINNL